MEVRTRRHCVSCRGYKLHCGLPRCPILKRIELQKSLKRELKLRRSVFAPSPSVFVGWRNYPKVFAGPLAAIEGVDAELADNPSEWFGMSYEQIVELRSLLLRFKSPQHVRARNKYVENLQEVAMASKPVDIEATFGKVNLKLSFSPVTQPMGPSADVEEFAIAENPRIPARVEALVEEGVKAETAACELYSRGFDVYYLTSILSAGCLGRPEEKKLVPTRWSITAVDDVLGRFIADRIRGFPWSNEHMLCSVSYLGNTFNVLLMPGCWEYEMFEAWAPRTCWTPDRNSFVVLQEHEGFRGRSNYAEEEGGGYYAARLAVLEFLMGLRKQAKAVVFREVDESYVVPVGVWEIRESLRHAFERGCERFSSLEQALEALRERLRLPLETYLRRSVVLMQRRLAEFG